MGNVNISIINLEFCCLSMKYYRIFEYRDLKKISSAKKVHISTTDRELSRIFLIFGELQSAAKLFEITMVAEIRFRR